MNWNLRSLVAVAGLVVALGALGLWAIRSEQRFDRIETLRRAPTAPPLNELRGGVHPRTTGQTVYVPVYSHVYAAGGVPRLLETTLSIRNTDVEHSIVIDSIRYYDTEGKLLKDYLEAPVILASLASTDFLVEHRDRAGGVGANFLVDWVSEATVTEPVIETVMVNVEGNRAFAFARTGYPISRYQVGDPD